VVIYVSLQAEDGIRDWSVTGVQTCALPICALLPVERLDRLHRRERLLRRGRAQRVVVEVVPGQPAPRVFARRDGRRRGRLTRDQIGRASCREREGVGGGG